MKTSSKTIAATALVSLAVALPYATTVKSQESTAVDVRSRVDGKTRRERLTSRGGIELERGDTRALGAPTEAPAGFDNVTNGFLPQGPPFDEINEDNVTVLRSFNDNRFVFEEVEHVADGLGPTYNAQSCGECHQNVVTGGASQIAEHRTGRMVDGAFFESLGGSLVHSRATHPDIVERVVFEDTDIGLEAARRAGMTGVDVRPWLPPRR